MARREVRSFCRICVGSCGLKLTVDEDDRLVEARGDHDDPMTMGYACIKGLEAPAFHNHPDRILRPLKRQPDGSFAPIGLEQALDEIAEQIRTAIEEDGPEAIGAFRGGGGILTASASNMPTWFLNALGSHNVYSTLTIDQSAKMVSVGRLGIWPAGRTPFHAADVMMIFGSNPLVSISTMSFDGRNAAKRMKDARARGMKLIVVDPRLTETARYADVFLQPYPGEDASIAAGMLRQILTEGWEDKTFCDAHVGDLTSLRRAVEPFTPAYVAARAGIKAADLIRAAQMFARDSSRGPATSGTGVDMSPHSNLSEHLIECLNVVCGRYMREGEVIPNPGILRPSWPRRAEVMPAPRWWEQGHKSRVGGYGMFDGEMCTGVLADEILTPGPGRIRCLINHGGNPAATVPDQRKITRAFKSLDLLVSIEPFMTPTAKLSHYIIPPKLQFERDDLPYYPIEQVIYPAPYTRYARAVAKPPAGSEVVDDWYVFWALAKRLGVTIDYDGVALDMETPPTTEQLLALICRFAPGPFEDIRDAEQGKMFDIEQRVEPGDPGSPHRFTTMPADVAAELADVAAEPFGDDHGFTHRLASRRLREVFNSTYRNLPAVRRRLPYNLAHLNPDDLATQGLTDGDRIELISATGRVTAVAAADPTVRPNVISMSHGWGGLPDEGSYEAEGANTNLLTTTDSELDPINAMPRMSAIPIRVVKARATAGASAGMPESATAAQWKA